jgi:hypothetical protein
VRSTSRPKFTAAVIAACAVVALAPGSASAAQPDNDYYYNAKPIQHNVQFQGNNTDATYADLDLPYGEADWNERYTPASSFLCDTGSTRMAATVWYTIQGTGAPIRVTTYGSPFANGFTPIDTLLAAYDSAFASQGCDDDSGPDATSTFTFPSVAGAKYYLQLGGYYDPGANTVEVGNYAITALTNDSRSNPETIGEGSFTRTNIGATTEAEPLNCNGESYHSTVWFRYVAPALGKVTFHASALNLAMTVYKNGNLLGCNDNDGGNVLATAMSPDTRAGDVFLIQVGGADQRNFTYATTFRENCDGDDDKVVDANRASCGGRDCDDANPNIRPTIGETVNNGVDENCDGYREFDLDGDTFRVSDPIKNPKPTDWDCDDRPGIGARIHPGARDVRGNSLNEDCVGGAAKALGLPSQVTDFWKPTTSGGVRVDIMKVKPVLKRSRILILCRGPGCPFAKKSILIRRRAKARVLTGLFRGRVFRTGAVLQVRVLPPSVEWIGRSETYRIRGTNVSATKGCFNFRGRKVKCPA